MAIPTLNELHRPVLEIANSKRRGNLSRQEFVDQLSDRFSLTDAERQEKVPSGLQTKMGNRVNWALTNLKKAGLMNNPQRGQWQITQDGRDFLAGKSGEVISLAELQKPLDGSGAPAPAVAEVADVPPDEQIALSHQQHQVMLSGEILDSMKSLKPDGFERLVVDLLSKMGYGEGRVTGRSGDGGIDGIVDEDTLGLEKIYIQAKKWEDVHVGSPVVNEFAGALLAHGAAKGVLITTSTFTGAARQSAQRVAQGIQSIRLIDGQELAELMIRYGVGVRTIDTYEVKDLDANYFAEV